MNLQLLRSNQRISRVPYIGAILGISITNALILILIAALTGDAAIIQGGIVLNIIYSIVTATVIIGRLHDCMLSGLWVIGLFIPYINIYVLYHLMAKGSWYME